tara:strand:+ start:12411 stop:13148 length:738 start_codon:yes stop_codon:yes gene_type:complete
VSQNIFSDKIELLVLDLDGTVFGNSRLLLEEIEDIRSLVDSGVRVVISSGRALHYVLGISRCLGLEDVVICEEGTVTYDCRTHELILLGEQKDLILLKNNLSSWLPFCIIPKEAHHDKNVIIALDREPRINVDEFLNEVSEVISTKNLNLNLTRSDEMINLMPPNITKGYALEKLLKSEKINPDSVVAIGDSLNDLSVFDVVKYSVAVSNSHDLVKEKSFYTSNKTNGHCVSEIIKFIISNNKQY